LQDEIVCDGATFVATAKFFDVKNLGKFVIEGYKEEMEVFSPLVLKPTLVSFKEEEKLFVGRTIEKKGERRKR